MNGMKNNDRMQLTARNKFSDLNERKNKGKWVEWKKKERNKTISEQTVTWTKEKWYLVKRRIERRKKRISVNRKKKGKKEENEWKIMTECRKKFVDLKERKKEKRKVSGKKERKKERKNGGFEERKKK